MRVVSIMAHADDEMRCLGTLLKCRARGDQLSFVTLTDGSKGFVQQPSIARAEAAAIRAAEMGALAAALGAEYVNLGEPDEFLYDTPELRLRLIDVIRATQADVVFTHYHEDYNLDHVTTNILVRQAAMQALQLQGAQRFAAVDLPVPPAGPTSFIASTVTSRRCVSKTIPSSMRSPAFSPASCSYRGYRPSQLPQVLECYLPESVSSH